MENTQKTILVVDDDPYMVDLLARQLKAKGFRVLQTTDPETAYSLAEKEQPNLIISDVAMPALDGFTLLKGLKNNKMTRGYSSRAPHRQRQNLSDVEEGFTLRRSSLSAQSLLTGKPPGLNFSLFLHP